MTPFPTFITMLALVLPSLAQQPGAPSSARDGDSRPETKVGSQNPSSVEPSPQPQGQVLFHRNEDNAAQQTEQKATAKPPRTPETTIESITETERSALLFTAWDLDLHVTPATSHLAARARFTVRNTSPEPLKRLVLQLSSSLSFESIGAPTPLGFTQHTLPTDADHTGGASEAVVALPLPLAPGETLTLTALYSGDVPSSGQRLVRIGAPPDQAVRADWDRIAPESIALRGFGNVLWYPVCSPPLFLGDGAKLFQAIGRSRLQQAASTLRVRLSIDYAGEPPADAFLNGQRLPLERIVEEPNALVAESHGVATAGFPATPIGFRTPSLFVTWNAAKPTENQLLSVITERPEAVTPYAVAADNVAPLLQDWLGPAPLTPLTLLDHPGQPFEDDAFLALPLTLTDARQIAPSLVHSLTHAWFRSSLPWLNEGVPQFLSLVASETVDGRDKMLAELHQLITPLTLMEPENAPIAPARQNAAASDTPPPDRAAEDSGRSLQEALQAKLRGILPGPPESYSSSSSSSSSSSDKPDILTSRESGAPVLPSSQTPPPGQPGQSLIDAHDEVYYRAKAAAVLVMLRSIVGDAALKQALKTYRDQVRHTGHEDSHGFQQVLEQASHKDLSLLFDDWVYHDRGLADLSIVSVTPRNLSARSGKGTSWLVAVEVHNAGSVTADVPVTVRSGSLTSTVRVSVPPKSTMSTRVVFEGVPQEVILNDGTVPETTTPMHLFRLSLPANDAK
ncbi:MAG: hypothetical protein JSS95_11800 [Acidobacteria bacterium]|nr:hypothetical protein [Acidobacteriota bacterium]